MFENPYGVPHEEIVAMLVELPSEVAAQVIFGRYVEMSGLVFTAELVQNLFDRTLNRVTSDRWQDPEHWELAKGWRAEEIRNQTRAGARKGMYFSGVDFARQTDYTVIFTLYAPNSEDAGSAKVVYFRRLNRVPWESIYREVGRCMSVFGPNMVGDASGPGGDVIFDALGDREYCWLHDATYLNTQGCPDGACQISHHVRLADVDSFFFTQNSKRELIETLRNTMSHGYRKGSDLPFGLLRSPPIVALEEELSFYAWDDKRLMTDTVMALGLACYGAFNDRPGVIAVGSPWGN